FRYPSYACADRPLAGQRGWGWHSSYGGCDRLDLLLRDHPYYYDARLYRGDRRAYFRDRYGDTDPRHEYKEPLDRRPGGVRDRVPQPAAPRGVTPRPRDPVPQEARPESGDAARRGSTPARRPSLERRGGTRETP